jgi:hypothetical protein
MSIIRKINHPGVEIREINKSQVAPALVGTNFLIPGYTSEGEPFEVYSLGSMSDYTAIFGKPTNDEQFYHYKTAEEVIKNQGTAICCKIPYDLTENYKYETISFADKEPISAHTDPDIVALTEFDNFIEISTSNAKIMSKDVYDALKTSNAWPNAGTNRKEMVVVNEIIADNKGEDMYEGTFIVPVTPSRAMLIQQMLDTPNKDTDMFDELRYQNDVSSATYTDIPASEFETPLDALANKNSLAKWIAKTFPTIEYSENGEKIDSYYSQWLGLCVVKTYRDTNSPDKLRAVIVESYAGSVFDDATDPATGNSTYICDIVNNQSRIIKVYDNFGSLERNDKDIKHLFTQSSQNYDMLNFCPNYTKTIDGNKILQHLDIIFNKTDNINEIQIDVVVDAGLSTIAQLCETPGAYRADTVKSCDSPTAVNLWRAVVDKIGDFCSKRRRDCMAIVDVPRFLVLEGKEKFIRKTKPKNTFASTIAPNLRYVTGINNSYVAIYSNWMAAVNEFSHKTTWLPETVKVAGGIAYNDSVGNIWDAPAGLNRGVINGIFDLAFNPNSNDMDLLYSKSLNYAVKYPYDGFIIEGQKTSQVKPSAFDRINVRRLFLRLERLAYAVCRYFVYEPNNLFTRRRLVDVLNPTFREVKIQGGLYDFEIVCDERNNTAEVIDRNELKCAFLLKPVRTAEFILCDFVATRTDANFEEIIQEI